MKTNSPKKTIMSCYKNIGIALAIIVFSSVIACGLVPMPDEFRDVFVMLRKAFAVLILPSLLIVYVNFVSAREIRNAETNNNSNHQ